MSTGDPWVGLASGLSKPAWAGPPGAWVQDEACFGASRPSDNVQAPHHHHLPTTSSNAAATAVRPGGKQPPLHKVPYVLLSWDLL